MEGTVRLPRVPVFESFRGDRILMREEKDACRAKRRFLKTQTRIDRVETRHIRAGQRNGRDAGRMDIVIELKCGHQNPIGSDGIEALYIIRSLRSQ